MKSKHVSDKLKAWIAAGVLVLLPLVRIICRIVKIQGYEYRKKDCIIHCYSVVYRRYPDVVVNTAESK